MDGIPARCGAVKALVAAVQVKGEAGFASGCITVPLMVLIKIGKIISLCYKEYYIICVVHQTSNYIPIRTSSFL